MCNVGHEAPRVPALLTLRTRRNDAIGLVEHLPGERSTAAQAVVFGLITLLIRRRTRRCVIYIGIAKEMKANARKMANPPMEHLGKTHRAGYVIVP